MSPWMGSNAFHHLSCVSSETQGTGQSLLLPGSLLQPLTCCWCQAPLGTYLGAMENHFSSCLHSIILPEHPPCRPQGGRTKDAFGDRSKTGLAPSWVSIPTAVAAKPLGLQPRIASRMGCGVPQCCRLRCDAQSHAPSCPGHPKLALIHANTNTTHMWSLGRETAAGWH